MVISGVRDLILLDTTHNFLNEVSGARVRAILEQRGRAILEHRGRAILEQRGRAILEQRGRAILEQEEELYWSKE